MQSSMASVISLVVAVLVALPGVVAHDKYPYAILYNGGSSCKDSAVAIRGYVIGDDNMLYGAGDVECSKEAVCFLKPESEYCQAMNFTRETVLNNLEILNGTVYQCDETNVVTPNQSVCYEHLATDCMESSVYSNCDYMLFTKDDLMKDPLGYLSNTGEMGDVFDDQIAIINYHDDACTEFAAIHISMAGELTVAVADNVECEEYLACFLNPSGTMCSGIKTGELLIAHEIVDDGSSVRSCLGDNLTECFSRTPDVCAVSHANPSCSFRIAAARHVYKDPKSFITPEKGGKPSGDDMPSASALTAPTVSSLLLLISFVVFG